MTDRVILIVEDNQVNLMILRATLRKPGYEPIVASPMRPPYTAKIVRADAGL